MKSSRLCLSSLLVIVLVGSALAAPIPKAKPLTDGDLVGTWELKIDDHNGVIEFRDDGTYTAIMTSGITYVGKWTYRNGELQAGGSVYVDDRKLHGYGGFSLKLDSSLVGTTYDNYIFRIRKLK